MPLVLDIETIPTAQALRAEYPVGDRQPPANYKSPDAIATWREKDRAAWDAGRTKEASLHPRLGRILCVGMKVDGLEEMAYAEHASEERELLEYVWKRIRDEQGQVVTWNGSFDLRFICIRSLYHGINPTVPSDVVRAWFKKYTTSPHFDCKAVLTNWDVPRAGEGLSEWASFLGLEGKTAGLTGADVYPLFESGHHEEIKQYCAQDVAATHAVYEMIAPMFGGVGLQHLYA